MCQDGGGGCVGVWGGCVSQDGDGGRGCKERGCVCLMILFKRSFIFGVSDITLFQVGLGLFVRYYLLINMLMYVD